MAVKTQYFFIGNLIKIEHSLKNKWENPYRKTYKYMSTYKWQHRLQWPNAILAIFNLYLGINESTRITDEGASPNDSFFTNMDAGSYQTKVIKATISDHEGWIFFLNVKAEMKPETVKRKEIQRKTIQSYIHLMRKQKWLEMFNKKKACKSTLAFIK